MTKKTALFLFASMMLGQQTALKPPERASIEGRVSNLVTGSSLNKAQVTARSVSGSGGSRVSTDSTGRFVMTGIDAGKYRLIAERNGYSGLEYGARSPDRPGTIVSVEAGQKLADIDFQLVPYSAIIGRVVDEDAEGLPNVSVYCLKRGYSKGNRVLQPVWAGITDDAGGFRASELAPGEYYLAAVYRPRSTSTAGQNGNAKPQQESYAPTFYQRSGDAASAAPIQVGAGVEVRGIEFTPIKTAVVRVRGRIANFQAGARPMITLTGRDGAGLSFLNVHATGVRDQEGNFEIPSVAPGSYLLTAEWGESGKRFKAWQTLEAGGADVDGITLVPAPGGVVSGRVQVEGTGNVPLDRLRVSLHPHEPAGRGAMAEVNADGSFALKDVGPDSYTINLVGLPDGAFLKSIKTTLGQEIMTAGLDFTQGGTVPPIEVTLSATGAQLEGTVSDGQNNLRWATVVAVPAPDRRSAPYWYKMATTDQYGRFTLRGVAPGEYKLFAWEDVENEAYRDPEFLRRFEKSGENVSVGENERKTVQLKLAEADGQTARR